MTTHTRTRAAGLVACAAALALATACGTEQQPLAQVTPSPAAPTSVAPGTPEPGVTTTPGSSSSSAVPPPPPSTAASSSVSVTGDACTAPPTDPEEYADAYIRAWGVGDRATMGCLAAPEAVQYSLDYRPELGPGWVKLRSSGDPRSRLVEYGGPNRKTIAQLTVAGSPEPNAIRTVVIG